MVADKAAARCHWHSMVEPVGSCAACGRAGCNTCVVQEPGGYRCQECIRKRRQIVQATPVPSQPSKPYPPAAPLPHLPAMQGITPQSPSPARFLPSDQKIIFSIVVFLAGVAIPFLVVTPKPTSWSQHIGLGYVLWALFWGVPAAWRLSRKFVFWPASFGCPGIGFGLAAAWLFGWSYCLLGGGIYQFLKHLRSVARTT